LESVTQPDMCDTCDAIVVCNVHAVGGPMNASELQEGLLTRPSRPCRRRGGTAWTPIVDPPGDGLAP